MNFIQEIWNFILNSVKNIMSIISPDILEILKITPMSLAVTEIEESLIEKSIVFDANSADAIKALLTLYTV